MKIIQKQGEIIENQSCGKQNSLFIQKFTIFYVAVKSCKYTEKFLETWIVPTYLIHEYLKGLINFVKFTHVTQSQFFVRRSKLQFEDFLIKIKILSTKKWHQNQIRTRWNNWKTVMRKAKQCFPSKFFKIS